jgi:outer membrane protein assembly factor BamA
MNSASMSVDSIELVIAPIPIVNPTIGKGLAVAGLMLYEFDRVSPVSSTTLAAGYTDTDSWGAGLLQKANLAEDRWRISGGIALALARYELYPRSDASDFHFTTEQRVTGGMAQVLRRVTTNMFAGLRFQRARVLFSGPDVRQTLIPATGLALDIGSLGAVAEWDSRDHPHQPRTGRYLTIRSNVARQEFGSDLDYATYGVALNHFRAGFRDQDVLASRLSMCSTTRDTPFFERCQFGASSDLRGYPIGRYFDDAMYAMQLEYRAPLWGRFSGVAFAGIGSIAGSMSGLDSSRLLPAAGAGLRYLASKDQRLNVSVDYAIGRDESAFYVYIGESF